MKDKLNAEARLGESDLPVIRPERKGFGEIPTLSMVFASIAVAYILIGAILCWRLWPVPPDATYQLTLVDYAPALIVLSSGIGSALLFLALAAGLSYLAQIRSNSEWAAEEIAKIRKRLMRITRDHLLRRPGE